MKRKRISDSSVSWQLDASGTSSSDAYHAFLNFRGSDLRYTFVDCLHVFLTAAGIRVFMDDEALHVGHSIGDELKAAIDSSKLYVPMFSRNYASSKWCLIELARMVDCAERSIDKEILPVFFDVEPEDVKLKTQLYAKDLLYHEECYGQETVSIWRDALKKVSEKKGWNLQTQHGQGKVIKQITEHISCRLERPNRILPDHFIGNETQVQEIMVALDCGSPNVCVVVIHGMGGIGKTTLAKAVFNKLFWEFQGCSFLSSVRESAATKGIVYLQNKLLKDLLRFSSYNFSDENDAMNCIQGLVGNKNVLIVLDDASDMDQIRKLIGMGDWLGLGSRVIITTRNLNCMATVDQIKNNLVILQGKRIYIHQMRELNFDDSLKLLCGQAFGEYELHHGYEQLSRDILSFTGGIPLAIEVIGSCLRGKRLAIWKETLNKLKEVPHDQLYREILMSSYKMLHKVEKQIFLDIVFFFFDKDMTLAFYYWEACSLYPVSSIDALISYAMIKIAGTDRFWMHDLFKELGREVVRKQSKGNLGNRSRLCNEDALFLLLEKEGTRHVKALKLDSNCAHDFTSAELSRLPCLRFMELYGGNFVKERGDGNCLSKIMWFSWQNCPVEFRWTNLHFQNLVVLRLSKSNITETWSGWRPFRTARNLKVLELEYLDINTTPDLSSFLSLEKLVIRECNNLVHIDTSIANLESLKSLELNTDGWMEKFDYSKESIQEVLHLPNSMCKLRALTRLVIRGHKLESLPDSIGGLKCLKVMRITFSRSLKNLPDSIVDLESLLELDLRYNEITELPESIGKLRRLTKLDVSHNKLRGLPATILDLHRLQVLDVGYNRDLNWEIPDEICNLQFLESLYCSGTRIWSLGSHGEIQKWTNLPESLTRLHISSESMKSIPDLSSLTNLVRLRLSNYDFEKTRNVGYRWHNHPALKENIMTWIQHLPKLEELRLDLKFIPNLSSLTNLVHLRLSNFDFFKPRDVGYPWENRPALKENIMTWIGRLPKLFELMLDLSPMPSYPSSGLDQLSPTITSLELSCPDPSAVGLPSGLESLTLSHCTTLPHWGFLSKLQGLTRLVLIDVTATEIRLHGLELLENLTKLSISFCKFPERVEGISRLRNLQKFVLDYCPELVEIVDLSQPPDSLRHLQIWNCDKISLPRLSDTKSRRRLNLLVGWSEMMRGDWYDGPYEGYFQRGEEATVNNFQLNI